MLKKILFFSLFSFLFLFNSDFASCNAKKNSSNLQKTFGMIKPSGMNNTNEIKNIIKTYKLKILKSKIIIMTEEKFDKLYFMHKNRPFFNELKQSMVGKEVEVMIIYGENAVDVYREAILDIRKKYSVSKTENTVHGSDTLELAKEEICLFFDC